MRVTIDYGSGSISAGTAALHHRGGIYVSRLEGWYGTPSNIQQASDLIQANGATWPARFSQSSRVVTVHLTAWLETSVAAARLQDELSGMFGRELTIMVTDPSGVRCSKGYLSDDPQVEFQDDGRMLTASLVLTCPDPLKYGIEETVDERSGVFTAVVGGTAPTFPVFEFERGTTGVSLAYGGRSVTWNGEGPATLDMRDLSPSNGSLSVDDGFALEPGTATVVIERTGGGPARMRYAPAWR